LGNLKRTNNKTKQEEQNRRFRSIKSNKWGMSFTKLRWNLTPKVLLLLLLLLLQLELQLQY